MKKKKAYDYRVTVGNVIIHLDKPKKKKSCKIEIIRTFGGPITKPLNTGGGE